MRANVSTFDESGRQGLAAKTADDDPARGASERRRIVYVDHTAMLGGGEIALLNLVATLDRTRFEPIVVLFSDGPLRAKLIESGIETHVAPLDAAVMGVRKEKLGLASLLQIKQVFGTLRLVPKLGRLLRSLRAELVHTNSLKSDLIGGLAARWAGVPVLWHVRDRIDADYLPARVVKVFRALCRFLPNFVVANSAATLATLHLAESGAGRRSWVVHDGTPLPDPPPGANELPVDPATVILVGRITRWKGQHVFIRAADLVRREFPGARFQIIGSALFGETEYEREIKDLARELDLETSIEFLGFRSDVPDLIRRSTVVVHASIVGEPFGQVVIEAMAAGRPVVATNGGGVPEIVDDQVTGLLVPMGDAPAMASAISHLLGHPESARDMGRRGRECVANHFTIRHTTASMEGIYDAILTVK